MRCRFPSCVQQANSSFALLPMCKGHAAAIHYETKDYYNKAGRGRVGVSERSYRILYYQIAHTIPWSREAKRLAEVARDG